VIEGLRQEDDPGEAGEQQRGATLDGPEGSSRSVLVRELRDFMLQLARATKLVLVVDDADRIDEPSAALIAALAHKTERHALLLVVSTDSEQGPLAHGPLQLLDELAVPIDVEPLSAEQSEALMRSVFGDVPNLPHCAARIHALAHGSPRVAMELAQHLVDRGMARYSAGSWSLPSQLSEHDLPADLHASLLARVSRLSDDARELVDALTLASGDQVPTERYPDLTGHRDARRVFKALDELSAARILNADAERHSFAQRGIQLVLAEVMPAERRATLHSRLADLLAGDGGDAIRRGHHLFGAGRDREAIELLRSINLVERLPPLPLLVTLVERAERIGLPPRVLHELRIAALSKASVVTGVAVFRRWSGVVWRQLEQDSGLARYRELAHLPESERLMRAMQETSRRQHELPESERVHGVTQAIRELARLAGAATSMASPLYDLELLESMPSLQPLLPLSPALVLVDQLITASKEVISGTGKRGIGIYRAVLERIHQADHGGLDDAQFERTRLGVEYALATLEAACGLDVEARAAVLESAPAMKVCAWRVRSVMHLHHGNLDEARRCGRRAELLRAQEGLEERYEAATLASELIGYATIGDLYGLKSKLDVLDALAAERPGWRAMAFYARGRYRELQGDLTGALAAIEEGLASIVPARHGFFCQLAGAHIDLLHKLGRSGDAAAMARAHVATAERVGQELSKPVVYVAASQALALAGEREEALALIDAAIAAVVGVGSTGFALGRCYEARARIATYLQQPEEFERYIEYCAIEYEKSRNPALGARLAAVVERGRHAFAGPSEAPATVARLLQQPEMQSVYDSVHSRMLECLDEADRGRCALTLLLQSTECSVGSLYGVSPRGTLRLLAALPEQTADEGVQRWLEAYLEADKRADEVTASVVDDAETDPHDDQGAYTDGEGRRFEVTALVAERGGAPGIVGLLTLQIGAGLRMRPSRQLCQEIALSLVGLGDLG
jgi:tetratricopeptide (TPR) repeat protein